MSPITGVEIAEAYMSAIGTNITVEGYSATQYNDYLSKEMTDYVDLNGYDSDYFSIDNVDVQQIGDSFYFILASDIRGRYDDWLVNYTSKNGLGTNQAIQFINSIGSYNGYPLTNSQMSDHYNLVGRYIKLPIANNETLTLWLDSDGDIWRNGNYYSSGAYGTYATSAQFFLYLMDSTNMYWCLGVPPDNPSVGYGGSSKFGSFPIDTSKLVVASFKQNSHYSQDAVDYVTEVAQNPFTTQLIVKYSGTSISQDLVDGTLDDKCEIVDTLPPTPTSTPAPTSAPMYPPYPQFEEDMTDLKDKTDSISDTTEAIAEAVEELVNPSQSTLPVVGSSDGHGGIGLKGAFNSIWHYVTEWLSCISGWMSTFSTILGSIPYCMVLPIYASIAILIVLGVLRRFFHL